MEPVQNVQGVLSPEGDELQVGLPHVAGIRLSRLAIAFLRQNQSKESRRSSFQSVSRRTRAGACNGCRFDKRRVIKALFRGPMDLINPNLR